jgi:hypothetical protein
MNIEITIEASAAVTPKLAMASRSQTTSYTRPQNPETTKKPKNHRKWMAGTPSAWILSRFCRGNSCIGVLAVESIRERHRVFICERGFDLWRAAAIQNRWKIKRQG